MWVSSHTSARIDRAQLVLELMKGSAMTKHCSLYHYRQCKPEKTSLGVSSKIWEEAPGEVGRKGSELANISWRFGIIEVGLMVQFQSLRQSEILNKDL